MAPNVKGKVSGIWLYENSDAKPVRALIRFQGPKGKDYRLCHAVGQRWHFGGGVDLAPLYDLTEVIAKPVVVVVEGEKCSDILRRWLRQIDLPDIAVTTSIGGAKSANKTDWSPLAGKHVIIIPDNNEAGRNYADDVRSRLAESAATVAIAPLPFGPDAPAKADIADAIDDPGGALGVIRKSWSAEESRRWFFSLIDSALATAESEAESRASIRPEAAATQLQAARGWLARRLADGPVPSAVIIREANQAGFSKRTLDRTKVQAGIRSMRVGRGWVWSLTPRSADGKVAKGTNPEPTGPTKGKPAAAKIAKEATSEGVGNLQANDSNSVHSEGLHSKIANVHPFYIREKKKNLREEIQDREENRREIQNRLESPAHTREGDANAPSLSSHVPTPGIPDGEAENLTHRALSRPPGVPVVAAGKPIAVEWSGDLRLTGSAGRSLPLSACQDSPLTTIESREAPGRPLDERSQARTCGIYQPSWETHHEATSGLLDDFEVYLNRIFAAGSDQRTAIKCICHPPRVAWAKSGGR
jgi:hypothetical protein